MTNAISVGSLKWIFFAPIFDAVSMNGNSRFTVSFVAHVRFSELSVFHDSYNLLNTAEWPAHMTLWLTHGFWVWMGGIVALVAVHVCPGNAWNWVGNPDPRAHIV